MSEQTGEEPSETSSDENEAPPSTGPTATPESAPDELSTMAATAAAAAAVAAVTAAQATARPNGFVRAVGSRAAGWVVAGVLALAVVGLSLALATTHTGTRVARFGGPGGPGSRFGGGVGGPLGGGAAGAFVGPNGGAFTIGTVASVSGSTFTVTTSAGPTVTVDEQSSTTYRSGSSSQTAASMVVGVHVIVTGTKSGATVTATQVIIVPAYAGRPFPGGSTVPSTTTS